ncbi:MAG: hypothetical protein J6J27_01570 [Alphaproteobacteria bacterium]|nr:hypothetical protein [Alphaproteobacteria bacterium]
MIMADFKITKRDLEEILVDAKRYLNTVRYDKNLDKQWNNIQNISETLDFIIARREVWEVQPNDELFQELTYNAIRLKEATNIALKDSVSSDKLRTLEDIRLKNKAIEKQEQNPKEKRAIEQHWVPHYDNRICVIEYRNYYYDNDGYLIEITKDGTRIKRDIQLVELNSRSR